jgi:hypothetical protein
MGISGLAVFLFFSSTMSNGQFKLLGLNFKLRSHWHDQPHDGIPDRLPSPRGVTVKSPSRRRLVPIIATSPEPMATARLGQMVTLSPRRLAEQPLRRACRRAAALAAALQSRRHRNRDRPPPVMRSPPSRSLPRQPRRSGFSAAPRRENQPGKSARPRAAGTGRTGALTGTCSHFSICITPCTHRDCLRPHSLV